MSALVLLRADRTDIKMTYDVAAVSALKTIPNWGRRFCPATKTWEIDASFSDKAIALLKTCFGDENVHVFDERKPRTPPAAKVAAGWATALRERLPPRLREPAYKALLRVVHPDTGGDGRITQELNDEFQRKKGN